MANHIEYYQIETRKRLKPSKRKLNNPPPRLPGEEWCSVIGYEGLYSVSNLGRVRRDSPGRSTFPGKILRPGKSGPYVSVALWKDKKPCSYHVHTLVAKAFLINDPVRTFVNHKDGDGLNNHIDNLEFTTHQENITHSRKVLKKNAKKLTEDQVIEIRAKHANGIPIKEIAQEYGLHVDTVRANVQRKWWKHI